MLTKSCFSLHCRKVLRVLIFKLCIRNLVSGWGKIQHPGRSVNILQQAMLPIVDSNTCQERNLASMHLNVTDSMICAGHQIPSDKRSGCHGDSGGPLICRTDRTWVLQGVVSWGSIRCDIQHAYTVFAKVSYFRDWIDKVVG